MTKLNAPQETLLLKVVRLGSYSCLATYSNALKLIEGGYVSSESCGFGRMLLTPTENGRQYQKIDRKLTGAQVKLLGRLVQKGRLLIEESGQDGKILAKLIQEGFAQVRKHSHMAWSGYASPTLEGLEYYEALKKPGS